MSALQEIFTFYSDIHMKNSPRVNFWIWKQHWETVWLKNFMIISNMFILVFFFFYSEGRNLIFELSFLNYFL